ncbi:hypothetical protein BKA70DRAFT_1228816 [Coprinopsis sp. MPI-PUGE-AT-0042]|nr:hypothetical protein BKA70DRAFT_1228816 [Coprinopsis sp. MPI-PUGE-AT-0042]
MNPYVQWSSGGAVDPNRPPFPLNHPFEGFQPRALTSPVSGRESGTTSSEDPAQTLAQTFFGYYPEELFWAPSIPDGCVLAQPSNAHSNAAAPGAFGSTGMPQCDPTTEASFTYPRMPPVDLPYVAGNPFHGFSSDAYESAGLTGPVSTRSGLNEEWVMSTLQEYISMTSKLFVDGVLFSRLSEVDFDTIWIAEIRMQIVLPLASKLWDEFRRILLEVIDYIIKHVLSDDRIFPEFRHDGRWSHQLRETLLWYAVSGAYIHFFFKKDTNRSISFGKRTEDVIHESAMEAYAMACAIAKTKACSDKSEAGVLLYRHGGVILAHKCLMNNIAPVFPDYVTILGNCDGPPTLRLLALPIALISATLYTCYIKGSLAIQAEDVLNESRSQNVLCTKLRSVGKAFVKHANHADEIESQYLHDAIRRPITNIIGNLHAGLEDTYSRTVLPRSTSFIPGIQQQDLFTGCLPPPVHASSRQ